jgi:hypothetical protein
MTRHATSGSTPHELLVVRARAPDVSGIGVIRTGDEQATANRVGHQSQTKGPRSYLVDWSGDIKEGPHSRRQLLPVSGRVATASRHNVPRAGSGRHKEARMSGEDVGQGMSGGDVGRGCRAGDVGWGCRTGMSDGDVGRGCRAGDIGRYIGRYVGRDIGSAVVRRAHHTRGAAGRPRLDVLHLHTLIFAHSSRPAEG